jgi:hypothetical protein
MVMAVTMNVTGANAGADRADLHSNAARANACGDLCRSRGRKANNRGRSRNEKKFPHDACSPCPVRP